MNTLRATSIVATLGALLFAGACTKKPVAKQIPPTPPPTAPTVALSASPDVINAGQSTTLTWNTTNATTVNISGIGTVEASGSKQVTPSDSTTYELEAKGAGGDRDTSARVTVNQPVAQTQQEPSLTEAELFDKNVKDVYFDYDRYSVRADQANITEADAKFLNEHPDIPIVIEGHCDDRGSEEYNLALGDNRANSVKSELVKLGVSANRIRTISYGKEKPFCSTDNENCWSQNRRDHFGMKTD